MKFVWVEGGTFLMGSPDDDDEADPDERPVHEVQLSGFWLGKYPVTQEEWEEVMGIEPSSFGRDRSPVEDVSWEDCQQFIHRLNERGLGRFRLPTEAEWEYAARGGQKSRGFKYAGSNKVDEVAWHYYNRFEGRNCVGKKKLSNELGLYDMSGNVWEWCDDWYDEEYYASSPRENPLCNNDASGVRVLRGGSYCHIANYCRSACRDWYAPGSKEKRKGAILQGFGFRLVRLPKD